MPLPSEIEYWEGISTKAFTETSFFDNVWKRPHQIRKLLKYDWFKQKVLEIGVGNGLVAGAVQVAIEGHWEYKGTELSPNFRHWANKLFHLDVVQADVRELPGEGYTRIIALDSLEHVRPDHRKEGYSRISKVAAPGCLLFIHLSKEVSFHDKEFDHPFGLKDFVELEEVGFNMLSYESYICDYPSGQLDYAFVVMNKK
jgi:methyltransferase family protein